MDTIAAIATGGGISAIGVIRISGPCTTSALDAVFAAQNNISACNMADKRQYYGKLRGSDGEVIDLCLASVSRAPHSYTGEDTAEIYTHGSPVVMAATLRSLYNHGVRGALPGEFTKRAFLNGKLDLAQAEAVIDVIEAETEIGAQNAIGQLRGTVSRVADTVYEALIGIIAHFHAVVDYPDEDIEEFEIAAFSQTLKESEEKLSAMIKTYERGQIIKHGLPVAILGRPNVGKSSLLNALLGYERAIVTNIAGTTRDTIEEKIVIGNLVLRVTDTAGIRSTTDTVESLGVERAKLAAEKAGLLLVVIDGSEPLCSEDFEVLEFAGKHQNAIIVVNKTDLPETADIALCKNSGFSVARVSAESGTGLDALERKISELYPELSEPVAGEIITNTRHYGAFNSARESIATAREAIITGVTPDAVLTELEVALKSIGEVTGKTMREDIVTRIFERFCVGK